MSTNENSDETGATRALMNTKDPEYQTRVQQSFACQPFMQYIGAQLTHIGPGEIDILLPKSPSLLQQHGFVHGGALTTIADVAAGCAAMTLSGPRDGVLTTELKVNFLRPADSEALVARGRVIKSGRNLTIVRSDVYTHDTTATQARHVLTGLVTMMNMTDLPEFAPSP